MCTRSIANAISVWNVKSRRNPRFRRNRGIACFDNDKRVTRASPRRSRKGEGETCIKKRKNGGKRKYNVGDCGGKRTGISQCDGNFRIISPLSAIRRVTRESDSRGWYLWFAARCFERTINSIPSQREELNYSTRNTARTLCHRCSQWEREARAPRPASRKEYAGVRRGGRSRRPLHAERVVQ